MTSLTPSSRLRGSDFLWRDGPIACRQALEVSQQSGGGQLQLKPAEVYEHRSPSTQQLALKEFFRAGERACSPEVFLVEIIGGRVHEFPAIISRCGQFIARDLSLFFGGTLEEHPLLHQRLLRSTPLAGASLAIATVGAHSYYHWLLDELPRLFLPELPDVETLIISRPDEKRLKALELILPLLSFRHSRLFWFNDVVRHVRCESLISTSYLSSSGVPSAYVVERWQSIADRLPFQDIKTPEKFLISRSPSHGRYLENESELMAFLSRKGYARVELEKLSWIEQVALFRNAREIVAPHGAGLANLVFCKQKPLVVELFNHSYVHWCFWYLASLVGANYRPVSVPLGAQICHSPAAATLSIAGLPIDVFAAIHREGLNDL